MPDIPALRRVASAVLLFSAIFGTLYAQGLGTVVGTVTDPSGGLVAAANLKITDERTATSQGTTTDAQGYYVFP